MGKQLAKYEAMLSSEIGCLSVCEEIKVEVQNHPCELLMPEFVLLREEQVGS